MLSAVRAHLRSTAANAVSVCSKWRMASGLKNGVRLAHTGTAPRTRGDDLRAGNVMPGTEKEVGISSTAWRVAMAGTTIAGGVLAVNIVYPMDPSVTTSDPIARQPPQPGQTPKPIGQVATVSEDTFVCADGSKCHAWLVLPKKPMKSGSNANPPVVVMGHGLTCLKDMGLYTYAVEFAKIGVATYMIDYRGFGLSEGEPRHIISAPAHTRDFEDAVKHVANDSRVDGSRIALWGTSLAGGHVVMAAGRLGDKVRAVISQAPMLDGLDNFIFNLKNRGVVSTLRLIAAATVDQGRGLLGMSPAYIASFGLEHENAILPLSQTELDQYFAIHPINQTPPQPYLGGWENKTPPRPMLLFPLHRPVLYASQIHGPVLYIVPTTDSIVPIEMVDKALPLSKHPRSRKFQVPGSHFQVYKDNVHLTLPEMVKFLEEELA